VSTPLGDFLRARRDATRPVGVGLPAGGRRRVPGLRRSELAGLAGISVEYLVRIEQGRDRNPSVSVINALADALGLDATERWHLRNLAKLGSTSCVAVLAEPRLEVRPTVRLLLDQLDPEIALVTNRLGDVLAYTSGFDRLTRPSGLLDLPRPNLVRFVFTDDRSRDVFPEWERVADELAFDLWLGPSVESSARLVAELAATAGHDFTDRFHRHELPTGGVQRWCHPTVGQLRFEREVLELPPTEAQQLVVLLPADDATADRLDQLRRKPVAGLRVAT
jgi:transcriptional regulator with XRE-family HTH domain